jgi:hypothetical protein
MDARSAFVLAVVALICGVFLIAFGAVIHDAPTATAGTVLTTAVVGYAFGDRVATARVTAEHNRRATDRIGGAS